MKRNKNTTIVHQTPIPIYCSAFLNEHEFVVGGGGGSSKSGIKNKLIIYKYLTNDIKEDLVVDLSSKEDAPMSLCYNTKNQEILCSINSPTENKNLKVFKKINNALVLKTQYCALNLMKLENYQNVLRFNTKQDKLFVSTTEDSFCVIQYPELKPLFTPKKLKQEILYDGDLLNNESTFGTVSNKTIHIYNNKGVIIKTIEPPINIKAGSFKHFRNGASESAEYFYASLNTKNKAYICKFNKHKYNLSKSKKVSNKQITTLTLSNNGRLIAFADTSFTITILDSNTLLSLKQIKKAHTFAITSLQFNPTNTLLLSTSADSSIRASKLPENLKQDLWKKAVFVLAILVVIIAGLAYQLVHANNPGAKNIFNMHVINKST